MGQNNLGQLGNGTIIDSNSPVQVSGLGGVTTVAGGMYYTIALKINGGVWTWGRNDFGQLGNGSTSDRSIPGEVEF